MAQEQNETGHPKGLYLLFTTEMWERFSYYGMRALFILYLTKALLFDKALASAIYGDYTSLVYLTPLIGGYMADKYWGNRKSIIVGGVMMAIGQFLMFTSGLFYTAPTSATAIMLGGLLMLIIGNGFFKPNISTMVGQLYPEGDRRIDAAFTIFYMGINLGAFIAPLICSSLGDTGVPADFKWGFLAACCGMILSLIIFIMLKDHYIVTPEGKQIGGKPEAKVATKEETQHTEGGNTRIAIWLGVLVVLYLFFKAIAGFDIIGAFVFACTIAAPGYIISDPSLTKIEKSRIWVIYIIAFFVIAFWAAFEQAGASLTFFAEEQTNRRLDWHIPLWAAYLVSAMVVGLLGWLIAKMLKGLKNEPGLVRYGLPGTALLAIVGIVYVVAKLAMNSKGEILYEEMPASLFQSVNPVLIFALAPLFAMLWVWLGKRNMEPASPLKQAIGLFLVAVGYVIIAYVVKDLDPAKKVAIGWLFTLYAIHTMGELCLSPIGLSMVVKLAPVRYASLLMGVWFLSTAAANKFAGDLSGLYPEEFKKESSVNADNFAFMADSSNTAIKIDTNFVKGQKADSTIIWKVATTADTVKKAPEKTGMALYMANLTADPLLDFFSKSGGKGDKLISIQKIKAATYVVPKHILKQIIVKDEKVKSAYAVNADHSLLYVLKMTPNELKKGEFVSTFETWNLNPEKPSIFGQKINNLYDFFIIFIILAGVASVILFFLSSTLLKMMHGLR